MPPYFTIYYLLFLLNSTSLSRCSAPVIVQPPPPPLTDTATQQPAPAVTAEVAKDFQLLAYLLCFITLHNITLHNGVSWVWYEYSTVNEGSREYERNI